MTLAHTNFYLNFAQSIYAKWIILGVHLSITGDWFTSFYHFLKFISGRNIHLCYTNSVYPDQAPPLSASDPGIHRLPYVLL